MKSRVLIVNDDLNFGGVESALTVVLSMLDPDAFDIELCLFQCHDKALLKRLPSNVRVYYPEDARRKSSGTLYRFMLLTLKAEEKLRLPGYAKRAARVMAKIYRLLYAEAAAHVANERYDVAVGFKQGAAAQFAVEPFIHCARRVVFYRHGEITHSNLYEPVFARADDVVTISDGMLAMLKARYPEAEAKMRVIKNPIPHEQILEKAGAQSIPRPEGRIVLASAGRFSEEKGFLLATSAARLLKERGLSFRWYFIGDGYQRAEIEAKIALYGLSEEIVITGYQQNPFPYMDACDIFVQPSRVEALGNTIVEAQVLKKPVAATRTLGAQSLIQEGENGALSDYTPESLADAILRLARDPQARTRMCEALAAIDYNEINADVIAKYRRLFIAEKRQEAVRR